MDIDIDVANREELLKKIEHHIPSRIHNLDLVKHNVGVYFQEIPLDDETGLSSIPYEEAENLGWTKIDILNNTIYQGIKDEEHLLRLMNAPVEWDLFKEYEIVQQLAHVSNHFDIIEKHPPTSVIQLAMILALIRPGKRYLVGKSWTDIEKEIWIDDGTGYTFKKAHALSYALSIVVQLNKIIENLIASS